MDCVFAASQPAFRRVFITGASGGIGEAFARHYAAQGAQLGLVARRGDKLDALAATLPGRSACYVADVRDAEAMRVAANDFISRFGVPDLVIANAGVSRGTLTEEAEDLAAFQAVFEINVMGMVHTLHPFVLPMRQAGCGQLVGIASVAGLRGLPGSGAYSASKAAAISYLESLRLELAGSGVAVTTLCPGFVRTPMTAHNPYRMPFMLEADDAVQRMARAIFMRRRYAIIPWPMAIIGRTMRLLPAGLWEKLASRMGRKPRR